MVGWTNLSSILGLLQALGSLGYFAVSIAQITTALRSRRLTEPVLRILQLIFAPLILLLSGGILFFNGWRLDPILQFQQLLLSILIGYLILLDLQGNRI
ncbi:Ycf66-like protein [Halomicronema hongdechloris C2206]|uniref:Ycf66-like protein n=1 Tax=Halomicronema hongdechloris C2206 TaxID=1641165 RepID=A0A1Z3HLY9_9CYAN|nr:Ycf66-like protein [Halomicronema hongdechloris C2206]